MNEIELLLCLSSVDVNKGHIVVFSIGVPFLPWGPWEMLQKLFFASPQNPLTMFSFLRLLGTLMTKMGPQCWKMHVVFLLALTELRQNTNSIRTMTEAFTSHLLTLQSSPLCLNLFSFPWFLWVIFFLNSWSVCVVMTESVFSKFLPWKKAVRDTGLTTLFGRAQQSRDGLMESCTCRYCHRAGPPPPGWLADPPPFARLPPVPVSRDYSWTFQGHWTVQAPNGNSNSNGDHRWILPT